MRSGVVRRELPDLQPTRGSREPLVDALDLLVGDAFEHMGQLGLRVDAVGLGGLDQRVGDGVDPAAGGRAHEGKIPPAERDGLHRAFGRVAIGLHEAMLNVWLQALRPRRRMTDRRLWRGLARGPDPRVRSAVAATAIGEGACSRRRSDASG